MISTKIAFLLVSYSLIVVTTSKKVTYPNASRGEVVDNYFGTMVADPYRWLEDSESKDTQRFIQEQNKFTEDYVKDAKDRGKIKERVQKMFAYSKEGIPIKKGKNYFIKKRNENQNQEIWYKGKSLSSLYDKNKVQVLLNPNVLSSDGTISIESVSFTKDGDLLAYTLSKSGSDWSKVQVRNVSNSRDFPEVLRFTNMPSIQWTHDNNGFFYTRFPEEKGERINAKIFYHYVGKSQREDQLIAQYPQHPDWNFDLRVSDDGAYLIVLCAAYLNENFVFYMKLENGLKKGFLKEVSLSPLITQPAYYDYVTNDGTLFYFLTNQHAPNNAVIKIDIDSPHKSIWKTIVAEKEKEVLQWAVPIAHDKLLVSYLQDVKSTLELRDFSGRILKEYKIEIGSIENKDGGRHDNTFIFDLVTFTNPGIVYKLEFTKDGRDVLEVYKRKSYAPVDTSNLETMQIFYTSKDGTKVPMFIVKRKNLVLNGETPALLYGYGGFFTSNSPLFSVECLAFVNIFDGIFALANIRGGGEYGMKWWDDGRLLKKQNVFDDFQYAAEYLIKENYTRASKLTVMGSSNGGLLVAATINQRPNNLFGAAIPKVGLMDMLRYQKFTEGASWCSEYGCSDNRTYYQNLLKYSPLHNIKKNTKYPAVLVITADKDDRVVPSHSYKYIAELQYVVGNNKEQTEPLLLFVQKDAGHGSGTPVWKSVQEITTSFSFIQQSLGISLKDSSANSGNSLERRFCFIVFSITILKIYYM